MGNPVMDGRRRRYVPVDVNVAFSKFGTKLIERWGMEGIGTWVLLLAAAKREQEQGTVTFTSEAELWTKVGTTPSGFTADAFLTYCGQQKQTRRTRSGRIVKTTITGWQRWNDAWQREVEAERMSRKRAGFTPDNPPTIREQSPNILPTEVEVEVEVEYEEEVEVDSDSDREGERERNGRTSIFKIPDIVKTA